MRMFLTAFGLYNPFVGPRLPGHSLIPIANDAEGGLDLDYSALLIAESFIIDQTIYEYVRDRRNWFLGPMWNSLVVLQSEGLLEITDYKEPLTIYKSQIKEKTSQLLESIDPWLSIARKHWVQVKSEFKEFAELYSHPEDREYDAAHFGILNYLERRDGKIDAAEVARLHNILERKNKLKSSEEEEIKSSLEPLVAQVLINDLLRQWFNAPFLDWDDAQAFHDRLHLAQWLELEESGIPSGQIVSQSRCLFQTILPELFPQQIEDVVRFLRNRRAVSSLREELWNCLRNGEKVSKDWMLRLHREAMMAQIRSENRSRIVKWIGRAADLLVPGLGTVGEVVIAATEDGVEHISNKNLNSQYEWLYVLQRMKVK